MRSTQVLVYPMALPEQKKTIETKHKAELQFPNDLIPMWSCSKIGEIETTVPLDMELCDLYEKLLEIHKEGKLISKEHVVPNPIKEG